MASVADEGRSASGRFWEVAAVTLITLLVISGWSVGIERLQSFVPGAIGMKLVTATAFLLSAAAIALQRSRGLHAYRASLVLAAVIALLGIASLIQDFADLDLFIDRMWLAERPGATETIYPGRMATNTAFCFAFVGTALFLTRKRGPAASMAARLAMFAVAIVAMQVLIGYIFSAQQLRTSAATTPMALPTALNFALLSLALARLRAGEWPMSLLAADTAAAGVARYLLPATILIAIAVGWLRLLGQHLAWYGTETGAALHALASAIVLSIVTLFTTSRLHVAEVARRRDQDDLRRAVAAQESIGTAPRTTGVIERVIAEESRNLIEVKGAAVATIRAGQVCYRAAVGTAATLEGLALDAQRSFITTAAGAGRVIFQNISIERKVEAEVSERMGAVSAAALPLRDAGRLIGAIVVFGRRRTMTTRQLDLLGLVGNAATAALLQAGEFESKERMLHEQSGALAFLEQQFQAFMTNIPAAAYIKEESGRYIYVNQAMARFLGQEPPVVLGSTDDEILPPQAAQRLRANESEVLSSGRTVEETIQLREISEAWWLLLRFPINAGGERRLLGGVAVDVTEHHRAEEQIVQLNKSLELRVAERTEELERINRELEAFTYSVSHDLRSPLRAVSGYSRVLEEDYGASLDKEAMRFLSTIRNEAQRMGKLIDDLLAFSRIGRQSVAVRDVDMTELVRSVFRQVQADWPDRVLELSSNELPPAQADPSLIRQVLVNLLGNAAKYARGEGSVPIEVGSEQGEEFNTYWVRDRGVGFDMRYVNKLFAVFQRLHKAEEFEGTGVGLAIVERIVTRHGGKVWAEGTVGEGATFFFTLPAALSPANLERKESLS